MYGKTLLPSIFIAIFSIFSAQCELPPEHPEVGLAPLVHPVGFPVIPEYKSSPLSGRWVWPLDHQSTSILNTRRWTQWFLFSLKEEKNTVLWNPKKVQFWDIIQYLRIIASSNSRLLRCNIFETRTKKKFLYVLLKNFPPKMLIFSLWGKSIRIYSIRKKALTFVILHCFSIFRALYYKKCFFGKEF